VLLIRLIGKHKGLIWIIISPI